MKNVHVNCSKCKKKFDSIGSKIYNWDKVTIHQNKIEIVKNTSDGYTDNLISRHGTEAERIYFKKEVQYLCDYKTEFDGLLINAKFTQKIHFNEIKCKDCFDNSLKDKKTKEYKINNHFLKIEDSRESDYHINEFSYRILREKNAPALDVFGHVNFFMTILGGGTLDWPESHIKLLMKEKFKYNYENIYTRITSLNPDRCGFLVVVKPLEIIK